MTESLFLVKYGEIALKKRNRGAFVRSLKDSVRAKLPDLPVYVWETFHRVFVRYPAEHRERVAGALSRTFGVVSFSDALRVENEMPAIEEAARELARGFVESGLGRKFKAEVRRADKGFPLTSYQIACKLGDCLLAEVPGLNVDVHHPDWVLNVEIRERAYLYGRETSGPSGLPTGSSGRGLLLLSGGIDSPVAGFMMAKRGLAIEAVYFHSPPFTSEQARQKVESLVSVLAGFVPGIVLHVVNFTPVLARIRERSRLEETTLLLRACMMEFASLLAARRAASCLITGESLGQVASQTVESMHFTGSLATLPVLRPLVGLNKDEIIAAARSLGTFDISNLPYPDCCVLFSPDHPLIHPSVERMLRSYGKLEIGELLAEALDQVDTVSPTAANRLT